MGDLSENFDRSEFACKCGCGRDTADHELVIVLEDEREYYQLKYGRARLIISSGNRCYHHNCMEGGADDSQHLIHKAADHHVDIFVGGCWVRVPATEQYEYLDNKYPDKYGIGLYSNRVHLDVRRNKWRDI